MFKLPELDYSYDALGKHISADIMELHHSKHHNTYVTKLNAATADLTLDTDVEADALKTLLTTLDQLPANIQQAVRNHGGGHYNHTHFWKTMSPNGGGQPGGALGALIDEKHGSFQAFVDDFTAKSMAVFGSGWCWLMADGTIETTANQDNPIMNNADNAPILGLDVWEHAYYLDYKNKRDDYIQAWWNVVDWEYVASLHSEQG